MTTAFLCIVMLIVGLYAGFKLTMEALRRHFPWTYMILQSEAMDHKERKQEKA